MYGLFGSMAVETILIGNAAYETILPALNLSSGPTKLSVGDKAHRAFNKTRLYSPNGKRECARRARQQASRAA